MGEERSLRPYGVKKIIRNRRRCLDSLGTMAEGLLLQKVEEHQEKK